MTSQEQDEAKYEQERAWGEEQAYQASLSAQAEYEARAADEQAREGARRISWPVDMRGWQKVGVIGAIGAAGTGWRAGLEVWALGNQRRLIEPGGPIVFSYEVGQPRERKSWDASALAYHEVEQGRRAVIRAIDNYKGNNELGKSGEIFRYMNRRFLKSV